MTAALKMAAPGEVCAQSKKLMSFCKTEAKSIKGMRQHIGVTHERMDQLLRDMLAQRLIWRQSNGMYKTCNNKLHLAEPATANTDSMAALMDPIDGNNAGLLTEEQASELASAHEELNINAHEVNSQFEAVGSELDANEEADNLPYRVTAAKETVAVAAQSEVPEHTPDLPGTSVLETTISSLDESLLRDANGRIFGVYALNENAKSISFTASEFAPKPYDLDAMANEFEAEQERGDQHVIDNLDAKARVLNYCQMLLSPKSTELRRCLDELQMDLAVIRLQQERSA